MEQTFAEKYPHLAMEWDYERNQSLKIGDVKETSRQVVSWVCRSGHRYNAPINNRVKGSACPYDSGKVLHWKEKAENEGAT